MSRELILNIIGGIAMFIFFFSSFIKAKKNMLRVQSIAHVFLIISEFMTATYSSIVQEAISIIRNIITNLGKNNKIINISIVLIGAVVGILVNILIDGNLWYGYLPVIANVEYTICVVNSKISDRNLKLSLAASNFLWSVYFMLCGIITSSIFNCLTGIVALYTFFTFNKKEEN